MPTSSVATDRENIKSTGCPRNGGGLGEDGSAETFPPLPGAPIPPFVPESRVRSPRKNIEPVGCPSRDSNSGHDDTTEGSPVGPGTRSDARGGHEGGHFGRRVCVGHDGLRIGG